MAVGNACVASTADGQGEILKDGEAALMFEPGDHEKMAEQLIKVLKDPGLEQKLREASSELAKKFDGRKAIMQMEDYYRQLVIGKGD